MKYILVFIFSLYCSKLVYSQLKCIDSNNVPKDYMLIMKYPKTSTKSLSERYMKMSNTDEQFVVISDQIDSPNSPLTLTLENIKQFKSSQILMYNDQPPTDMNFGCDRLKESGKAHSKGIIAIDYSTNSGIYIQHSVPCFPVFDKTTKDFSSKFQPTPYAQHIFCTSMTATDLDKIVQNVLSSNVLIYYNTFQQAKFAQLQNIAKQTAENIKRGTKDMKSLTLNFKSQAGQNFLFFTKTVYKNYFIYEDLIAPELKENLVVMSWGRPQQPSNCTNKYHTINIRKVRYNNIEWKNSQDHSKWLISQVKNSQNKKWACFGDMNRMSSQAETGGSYLCFINNKIHTAMSKLVDVLLGCDINEKKEILDANDDSY